MTVADGIRSATDPADLGVLEASSLLRGRSLSAAELTDACLARIEARNGGAPTFAARPDAVNAWVRLYPELARASARAADERLAAGDAPALCGIPVGLKDLYGIAGLPLTASSHVLEDNVADADAELWARLRDQGMVPARPYPHPRVRGGRHHRPGRQPVGAGPRRRRVERRERRGARRGDGSGGAGIGHVRLAAHPVGVLRHERDQADPWPLPTRRRSSRWPPRSTTRARWRGPSPIARRCWRR